ncbi:unnamed protein product [Rodentolepis nana]|uniref:SUN2 n=1 Tax=Rodentolepis nana TaxID=102285 RepID=A0A0R3TJR5_RODNA|nr:unnamed protein product [Rodentolepis nana]
MSSSSSSRFNQMSCRKISLNTDNLASQQSFPGRHLRRIREPVYVRKYSDRIFTHTRLSGIKSSLPEYGEESQSVTGSAGSQGDDLAEVDFSDVHSSRLALNPTPHRRTSFLYRADSSEAGSPYSSRRPSVSCGGSVNL